MSGAKPRAAGRDALDSHLDWEGGRIAGGAWGVVGWFNETKRVLRDGDGLLTAAIGLALALVSMNGMRLNTLDGIYPVELSLVLRHLLGGIAALVAVCAYRASGDGRYVLSKSCARVNAVAVLFAVSLLFRYSQSLLETATSPALVMAGKLFEEFFGVLLILAWAERIVPKGFQAAAVCLGAAVIAFAAVQVLLAFFQRVPSMFALVILPIVSAILFKMYLAGRGSSPDDPPYEPARTLESASWPIDLRSRTALLLYFGILFAFVFVVGQLLRPSLDLQQQNMSSQLAIALGNALSGAVILLVAGDPGNLKAQPRFSLAIFFLALFALTTVSFALQANLNSVTVVMYLAITTLVSGFTGMQLWFSPYAVLGARWNLAAMVAAGYACNLLARTVSSANMLVAQHVSAWPMGLPTIGALLTAFVLCAVLVIKTRDAVPVEPAQDGETPQDRALAAMARDFGLTGQEARVLAMCARGMNARAISEEMTVTLNTTKSHMRMLYAKLGVHSQQELIDLVAQRSTE